MPIDLTTLDPATLQAGREADRLIALVWTHGEEPTRDNWPWWKVDDDGCPYAHCPPFSTDPAHAGELRRMAAGSEIWHPPVEPLCRVTLWVAKETMRGIVEYYQYSGECEYAETNGVPGKAEALAVCRAWWAAIQQRERRM